MNSVASNYLSQYQKSTTSGSIDIGIRKFEFVAKTQFLLVPNGTILPCHYLNKGSFEITSPVSLKLTMFSLRDEDRGESKSSVKQLSRNKKVRLFIIRIY